MSRSRLFLIAALLALAAAYLIPSLPLATAATSAPPTPANVFGFTERELETSAPQGVLIEFVDPPAAEAEITSLESGDVWTESQREAAIAAVRASQDAVLDRIVAAGIPADVETSTEMGPDGRTFSSEQRTDYLFNAARLAVPGNQIERLARIPGVARLYEDEPRPMLALTDSTEYTQAPQVWAEPPDGFGTRGEEQVIAVIDTGIDWNHQMFGDGPVPPAPLPPGPGDGCNQEPPPAACASKHQKIIFATSKDGGTPMDSNGHGTHVASTAAGSTAAGDEVQDDPVFGRIEGTAPDAFLMAWKTLTDAGVGLTIWSIQAMEEASQETDDHPKADVMNLSLGGLNPNNQVDQTNAVAADNASRLGVVMAIAAGNCGSEGNPLCPNGREGPGTVSAPGTSRLAISVGASSDPGNAAQVRVVEEGGDIYQATVPAVVTEENPIHLLPIQELLVNCGGSNTPTDCGGSANAEGRIALIFRGQLGPTTRTFEQAQKNAEAQGVIGSVWVNSKTTDQTGDEPFDRAFVTGDVPMLGITFNNGEAIKPAAFGTSTPAMGAVSDVKISMELAEAFVNSMAGFSSMGPLSDYSIKPDVTTPGINILAANCTACGGGYASISGTSMASPHTAGLAALLLNAHPGWGPPEVKAALMNTGEMVGGAQVSVNKQGGGAARVFDAARTPALLINPSFSFGEVVTPEGETGISRQRFRITDEREDPVVALVYDLGVIEGLRLPEAGFDISFRSISAPETPIASVAVPLGGAVDFMLRVEVGPDVPESPQEDPENDEDDFLVWEGYEFFITATPAASSADPDAPDLHAPIHYRHVNEGTIKPPPAPILQDPGDLNETGDYLLEWSEVGSALRYQVEESTDLETLISDDAEGNTTPSEDEMWSSDGGWTASSARSNSPTTSYFSGQGPDQDNVLVSAPFAGASFVRFWEYLDTEDGFDFAYVRAVIGEEKRVLRQVSGFSEEWREITLSLPEGTTALEFVYQSDSLCDNRPDPVFCGGETWEGWFIDDISLLSAQWDVLSQPEVTEYRVENRANNTYYYRVAGLFETEGGHQVGPYSNIESITVDIPCTPPIGGWMALERRFSGGIFVASGDVDRDGCDEVIVGSGAGMAARVRVFDADGSLVREFSPYGTFSGGVRVASGDLNGDRFDDIIVGAGPGGGPHVKAYSGETGALMGSFMAFDIGFRGGVFVGSGNVDDSGPDDIVVGVGEGGGPHVKVFRGSDLRTIRSFFAYATGFTGGVRVAAGDVDDSGGDDIVTGAGPGGGPHVKVFRSGDLRLIRSFFAYATGFTGGVFVASGDLDGDGRADIITGAGSGGGPHVRAFDGQDLSSLASFFAYDRGFTGGVRVGSGDYLVDGVDDIITGAGPGGGPHVKIFP